MKWLKFDIFFIKIYNVVGINIGKINLRKYTKGMDEKIQESELYFIVMEGVYKY